MEELRAKVRALLSLGDSDMTANLIVDVVGRYVEGVNQAIRDGASDRQRRKRERDMSRDSHVTDHVTSAVTVTSQVVSTPPLASPPLSGSSLSLRADPDPERAIPGLMPFPVVGATDKWEATQELLDEHQAAFPSIDVLAEYRKARAYLISNPTNRKTGKGMPRTLFSWLARGQERGTAVKRQAAPQNAAGAKPSALAVYCDWHKDARNDKRPNQFKPKDDCPSCKHLRAAARPREDNSQLALGGRS